jgi:hypothetical protein
MKTSKVTAFHLPWTMEYHKIRENWFVDRNQHISFGGVDFTEFRMASNEQDL